MTRRLTLLCAIAATLVILILLAVSMRSEWRTLRTQRVDVTVEFAFGQAPAIPQPAGMDSRGRGADTGGPLVRGLVTDPRGSPVARAMVAVLGLSENLVAVERLLREQRCCSTGPDGTFEVAPVPGVWPSTATLDVQARGFLPYTRSINADDGERINIVLQEGFRITGRVFEPTGDTGVPRIRVVARGVGASVAASNPEIRCSAGASYQATETAPDGTYVLDGLATGWYQVDVVAPGLRITTMSGMNEVPGPGAIHGVHARAGATDVNFRVLPIAVVSFVVRDHTTGACVPWAITVPDLPEGRVIGASSNYSGRVLVCNGRTWDCRRNGLSQGQYAYAVVSRTWPECEFKSVAVRIRAEGYERAIVEVPTQWAGATDSMEVTVIDLKPTVRHGTVRFRLRDVDDAPIADAPLWLLLGQQQGGSRWVWTCFDNDGASGAVALPVGTWKLGTDPTAETLQVREDLFTVTDAAAQEVAVYLMSGGFRVTVTDEGGEELDDVGVLAKPGHAPVQVEHVRNPQTGVISTFGEFLRAPGGGHSKPVLVPGARAGPWTVEAYRHGYEPARQYISVSQGRILAVQIRMRPNPDVQWNSWEREPVNRFEDVIPASPGRSGG